MSGERYPLISVNRLRMGIDGPGVTTLVAGAGCPLKCRWCINGRLLREAAWESVTPETLYDRVKCDDLYFRASGGGVCFGGGEPLLHAEFIRQFRELCPPDWRIIVETSLAVPRKQLLAVMGSVDLFIVDCKDMDSQIYHRYTGGSCDRMQENLQVLRNAVGAEKIRVRVPLIPEYNTPEDQMRSVEKLRAMGITQPELFSYVIRSHDL